MVEGLEEARWALEGHPDTNLGTHGVHRVTRA